MASGGFPPNPYEQGFPQQRGNTPPMYRSQQPRFQRSPRPRFHQQYIPHYGGPSPRGPSPRGPSPRGERFQGRPWQPRFPEGHSPQWTPSPRRDSGPYRGRGGRHRGNVDCNPGGSDDISQYYSPSMVEDPWAGMKPVPLTEHSNFTT